MIDDEQEFDIAALEEEESRSGSAVAIEVDTIPEPTDAEPESQTAEVVDPCPKCGVARNPDYAMCRSCGFYERLNTFVEVDADDPDEIISSADPGGFKMPSWGWILIGIQVFILLESLFVMLNVPNMHIVRIVWSLAQLTLGFIAVLTAHGRATFMSIMADAETDIGDFLVRPIKLWGIVLAEMPKNFIWVAMGTSGLMAMLMSIVVIRSIPYNKLFETDAPPPKAPSLAKAIADQAKDMASDMSMEEAMNEFAGNALGDEEEIDPLREKVQGVIVGYYAPDKDNATVSSVIVATAVKKKLQILGTFSAGLDEEQKTQLAEEFRSIRRPTPFVDTNLSAKWIQPVFLCEVSYKKNKKGSPRELRFERLIGKARMPGPK
jgi:hypothetical protein